jgi:predicted Zn-dependent protease
MNNPDDVSPENLRLRIADLERAVTIDSSFADAWGQLAITQANLYTNTTTDPALAEALRQSAEHARAAAPGSSADHLAWGAYYSNVMSDFKQAERELRALHEAEPRNANAMVRLGRVVFYQNRSAEALPLLEASTRLDPLNSRVWAYYEQALHLSRRYPEAARAAHQYTLLAPTSPTAVMDEIGTLLGQSDLDGARAVIRNAYARIPPVRLDAFLAIYYDYGWILDDTAQRRVLAAPLDAFDGDPGNQAIVDAQIYQARGDSSRSRAAAQRAYEVFLTQLKRTPEDVQLKAFSAFAAALAGRVSDARRFAADAASAIQSQPMPPNNRSYFSDIVARVHALDGDHDKALDALEQIMSHPGMLTVGNLKYNQIWASLRGNPRFERLLATH